MSKSRILAEQSARIIKEQRPGNYRYGLIFGSGLGGIAELIEDTAEIPFSQLPGFPELTVASHAGKVIAGSIAGQDVIAIMGRAHYYEHGQADIMRVPIETLKVIGCDGLILTNSAGSLREDLTPGSLMMVRDHIALNGPNPLIAERGSERFVDMSCAYDIDIRRQFTEAADKLDINLPQGIYMWFQGPSFETPAEVRLARLLGADAVGMSTVQEVLIARYLDLNVSAFSILVNYGSGMRSEKLTHQLTLTIGYQMISELKELFAQFFIQMAERGVDSSQ